MEDYKLNLIAGVLVLGTAGAAQAAFSDWESQVALGASAGYTNSNITSPIVDNIGSFDDSTSGGVTYEFVINASKINQTSALMGARYTGVGTEGAIKLEQWPDQGVIGLSDWNAPVNDLNSTAPSIFDEEAHIVVVSNGTSSDIYVNGVWADNVVMSLAFSGDVGLGIVYRNGAGDNDGLDGTILGVAIYDSALSATEISDHYAALIPEPTSIAMIALGGFAMLKRRN